MPDAPRAVFLEHARRGELAYQVGPGGRPVFYPRVLEEPEWRVSSGRGTVYATTVVHRRGGERHNVALIDLAGMYGLLLLIEAVRQLRGERQVPGCEVALADGNGGVLSSQCTVLLGGAGPA